jgi:hypothetical protein
VVWVGDAAGPVVGGRVFGPLLAGIVTGATGEISFRCLAEYGADRYSAITLGASGMRTRRGDSVQA